jgi:hypothetical protein
VPRASRSRRRRGRNQPPHVRGVLNATRAALPRRAFHPDRLAP